MIEDLYQFWDDSSWIDNWKNIYIYDANNNMIEDLWQCWDGSSWGDPLIRIFTHMMRIII